MANGDSLVIGADNVGTQLTLLRADIQSEQTSGLEVRVLGTAGTSSTAAVTGRADTGHAGILGIGEPGVRGRASDESGTGVSGFSAFGAGVHGGSNEGAAVAGEASNVAVFARNTDEGHEAYLGSRCCAGDFYGDVWVHGALHVTQRKLFTIDHPLDPDNLYLSHASVESADMKTLYDGIAILGADGAASVELPRWFEALNTNVRYQLTCVGGYAPVYVAEGVRGGRFIIAGGAAGLRVSWQVTGIRHDAWAERHPFAAEHEKAADERGTYVHPELHGAATSSHLGLRRHGDVRRYSESGGR